MIKTVTISCFLFLLIFPIQLQAWGQTGHRVVGEIAMQYAKKRTQRKVLKMLKQESLAAASNHADYIKSDPKYNQFYPWHYVNFKFGESYSEENRNPDGDIVFGIQECVRILNNAKTTQEEHAFYLKMLAHLVGDLHQPLHVGNPEDKGGNTIKVKWFWQPSNLHRVWDEDMIDYYKMSYTELAADLPTATKKQRKQIQSGELLDWVYESQQIAQSVYASAKAGDELKWEYQYVHFGIVKEQLLKAGLRLAKLLDDIYA